MTDALRKQLLAGHKWYKALLLDLCLYAQPHL